MTEPFKTVYLDIKIEEFWTIGVLADELPDGLDVAAEIAAAECLFVQYERIDPAFSLSYRSAEDAECVAGLLMRTFSVPMIAVSSKREFA